MKYKNIIFTLEAIEDIKKLETSLQKEALLMIRRLDSNIHFGLPLGNKHGIDLSNYYKIYFNEAKHRIVYTIVNNNVKVEGINEFAKIVGVGKRADLDIYKKVYKRINKDK